MAGLTDGKLYLFESESGQQDWITDNSGDPDAIVIGNFTIVTHYCLLDFVMKFDKRGITGARVPPSPGGAVSADQREEARYYIVTVAAQASSKTQADRFDEFCMSARHTKGDANFKRYHLIMYHTTNVHGFFTDADGNRKSYLTGIVSPDFTISLDEAKPLIRNVNFVFKSVWS